MRCLARLVNQRFVTFKDERVKFRWRRYLHKWYSHAFWSIHSFTDNHRMVQSTSSTRYSWGIINLNKDMQYSSSRRSHEQRWFKHVKGSWIHHWLYIRTTLYVRTTFTSVTTGVVPTFVWPQPKGSPGEHSPSEQVQTSEKILSIYAHWRRLPASWNRIDGEAWSWDSRCLPRKRLIFIR